MTRRVVPGSPGSGCLPAPHRGPATVATASTPGPSRSGGQLRAWPEEDARLSVEWPPVEPVAVPQGVAFHGAAAEHDPRRLARSTLRRGRASSDTSPPAGDRASYAQSDKFHVANFPTVRRHQAGGGVFARGRAWPQLLDGLTAAPLPRWRRFGVGGGPGEAVPSAGGHDRCHGRRSPASRRPRAWR